MIKNNIFSGITVGIIALPLSMALAIAIGVAPQYGIYTAIVGGIVASIFGSSRVNITGPTAAFVVILIPIVQKFGFSGLLICGFLSGVILVLMGVFRLGKLIELIPYPVTIGFTTGIAVVIATFQIKDFFGLQIENFSGHFHNKVYLIAQSFSTISLSETFVAAFTLLFLILWTKTKSKIPGALVALSVITIWVFILNKYFGYDISTINSTFSYESNGETFWGIPPVGLNFYNPLNHIDFDLFNLETLYILLPHSIAIAILGALESLLCSVITDGMTKNKTNPNKELIGQGLANMSVPFFAGIPATAAIARSAANIKAGATSKLSAVIHSTFLFLSIILLAPYLSYLPMAALAALLLIVAWNMSEVKHFVNIIKIAPKNDIYVLLTCFLLTVFLDMQVAVGVGIALAAILFIKRTIDLYKVELINNNHKSINSKVPKNVAIYNIDGPMFFGITQSALRVILQNDKSTNTIIINMENVPMIDMTGIVAFKAILEDLLDSNKVVIISGMNKRVQNKLNKANILSNKNIKKYDDINEALTILN
ncbi:MAG: C4-dicarboxylic acid transporter DauA [Campylobacterota bacterium]